MSAQAGTSHGEMQTAGAGGEFPTAPAETEDAISQAEAERAALNYIAGSLLPPKNEPALVEDATVEKPWGWVFFWNTRLFTETGDLMHAVIGPAPVCVDRRDGSAASIDALRPLDRELRRYERKIGVRPWWKLWK